MFTVPEFPLYMIGWILCILYLYRFFQSSKKDIPTNYTFIGKAFAWGLLAGLYFWAGHTVHDIIFVRNFVRLGNLLLMIIYLIFMTLELWLERKYR